MTLSLSVPEFLTQHPNLAKQRKRIRQPWKIPLVDISGHSYGYRQEVNLRPGLNVLIDDYTLQEDLVVETDSDEACPPALALELSVMLSGHNRLEGVPSRHNFLAAYWEDNHGGQFHWTAGERVLKVDIHMSAEVVETFLGRALESLPLTLSQLGHSAHQTHQPFQELLFAHTASTTVAMRSAIQQLLNCPYKGLTRWLYWEGKVLELIALRLEQLGQDYPNASRELRPDDVDRIYAARDILLQQLTNSPSLMELSRQVGLNDYKLKKGFRQVFGTTVFGYLSQQRMQKAQQLLSTQQSISAVAIAVGYTSPTAFSGAFKRQFGISPKRYQLSQNKAVC